jgi:hypothetical protein
MRWYHTLLAAAAALVVAAPVPAGILFGRKNKPNPAQRVPELVHIVKTEKDDRKRANAAEELLQFDAAAYPDIVPVLIEALQSDPKIPVRLEAAHSLGKIRPASLDARQALERAIANDGSLRVRLQARTALLFYPSVTNQAAQRPPAAPQQVQPQGPPLVPPPVVNPNSAPPVSTGAYRPLPSGPTGPGGSPPIQPVGQTREPPLLPVEEGPRLVPPPQ